MEAGEPQIEVGKLRLWWEGGYSNIGDEFPLEQLKQNNFKPGASQVHVGAAGGGRK